MTITYGPDERTLWAAVGDVTLESGAVIDDVRVAYRTWGTPGEPAVLLCHALTGDANADEWWGGVVGPGLGVDTDQSFVISSNVLGSCYGTTGPADLRSGTDLNWGPEFPDITIRDMVEVQSRLLDALGVETAAVVGGSMGGMQALEWAVALPERVDSLIVIAAGATHSPWCIGLGEAQRLAIEGDAAWLGGRYPAGKQPERGLALARKIAMVSYRSPESFRDRFGRDSDGEDFAVQRYLRHHGAELVRRFDANAYLTLTRAMDTHDVGRARGGVPAALRSISAPTTVVGITSDVLYPTDEQREVAALIPTAEYIELDAPDGHDAFLIETSSMSQIIGTALGRRQRRRAA
ncbi:homoserine O-acetyltransferase [bacterium]|nr:homoserine O-acetyltransferase [bacterium]